MRYCDEHLFQFLEEMKATAEIHEVLREAERWAKLENRTGRGPFGRRGFFAFSNRFTGPRS